MIKKIKKNDLITIELSKKELDFISSLVEAQKYKMIFTKNEDKSSDEFLNVANKIEDKLGYVLGY